VTAGLTGRRPPRRPIVAVVEHKKMPPPPAQGSREGEGKEWRAPSGARYALVSILSKQDAGGHG